MSLPSWVRVGAKCVCVDTTGFKTDWNGAFPQQGVAYVVRGHEDGVLVKEPFIFLEEIPGPCSWRVSRFRPLVDDSDEALQRDLREHFHPLLTSQPDVASERERADV